ncbi:ATP-binding protein [Lachnospiraceae bacterium ZAX-1]
MESIRTFEQKSSMQKNIIRALKMSAIFAASSLVGYLFHTVGFSDTNIVIVYLLSVLLTAWLTESFAYGIFASVIATFLFGYFFAEPFLAFSVSDPAYIIIFITMTITALITSTLTSHAKRSERKAKQKEAETKAIYNLTNHLTDAKNINEISEIVVCAISECFSCNAGCLCFSQDGIPEKAFIQQTCSDHLIRRETADAEIKYRMEGLRIGYDVGVEFVDWPIYGNESTLGIIRIPKETGLAMSEMQRGLLRAMIESAALAMDRFRLAEQRILSSAEAEKERYRGILLRAISHDLRTPLSGIMGTAEMLMDMNDKDSSSFALARDIYKDADWLRSLVENILSLTRLQSSQFNLKKQMESVEEVIGSAVANITKRSPEYEIAVDIPNEILLVPMDVRLIEQVLINLLDNAVKHTPPYEEIGVSVRVNQSDRSFIFKVWDSGTGIAPADISHLFQEFYTTNENRADTGKGIGLGLAICETIVKAHGGIITAENCEDGKGAKFTFTLPMEEGKNDEKQ